MRTEGVYEDNLRHYARPATEGERADANSETLVDYEALYLAEILHEWAEYICDAEDLADVARGYVEFIRRKQSESGGYRQVTLYAHTPQSAYVLEKAVEDYQEFSRASHHPSLAESIEHAIGRLADEHREEDDG